MFEHHRRLLRKLISDEIKSTHKTGSATKEKEYDSYWIIIDFKSTTTNYHSSIQQSVGLRTSYGFHNELQQTYRNATDTNDMVRNPARPTVLKLPANYISTNNIRHRQDIPDKTEHK